MTLNDAETQLLAMLYAAGIENQPTDRNNLELLGERYWIYQQDWSKAYDSLTVKELIQGSEDGYQLTETGRALASDCHHERPDRYYYYYRQFYRRAYDSEAHSRLCEKAFGLDLTQEGQMDKDSLRDLMRRLDLKPGQAVLDLGCGAGGIAEYIADQTGAKVTGIDYAGAAIEVANERTAGKRGLLEFIQGDLNHLDLPAHSYDAAVMIDSIYWVGDAAAVIERILRSLRKGGQLIIVIVQALEFCDEPEEMEIDKNFVAKALEGLKVGYTAHDTTDSFLKFWPNVKRALDELRDMFIAEGNEFIYQSLLMEAETEFLPAIEVGEIRRYLYHVRP